MDPAQCHLRPAQPRGHQPLDPPPPAPDAGEQRGWQAIDDAVTEKPFSRDNQRFWVAAAARLEEVRRQVAEDGGRLVVLTLPRWRDVYEPKLLSAATKWGPWCAGRPGTLHVDATPASRPPMESLRQDFLATGMDWNATYDFTTLAWTDAAGRERRGDDLAHAGDSLFLLNDTGHYTPAGHALLGQVLFDGLSQAGWLP